ncbi:pantoate--beta-alanine ligase [Hoylesella nanceiensis]|jgi:pantoate--beta-alanine ligase|uniref:pantoate--beta-alanine ligase n=1 Tax=Hoylesella nanceiensis TaxID=425941 RepID=UPI001CB6692D|nr:pantoate--beta-alanine ligase [Hoylesella nanceiensis]MBF1427795.1 pantoate--beta-alanine ligase [Hoylesella nanceiensis]MBF1429474.1 pantoate--beta-alanine ligase [Hoylesella nanceiensis]
MKIFDNIVDLQNELFYLRKANKKIGLVPTMGALHQGHASLVKQCVADNDITIVSVFLNPTQFNDPKDLERYPRTFEEDCKILNEVGADIVFAPTPKEMYPTPDNRHFEFPPTSTVMEGAKRPGHFNGVCQVVSRLFYITKPHNAYFGEKDWQQICVIKQLVKYLNLDINIIECPIIREESGLAMSSRNALLTSEERAIAANIYRILKESVAKKDSLSVDELQQEVINSINAIDQLEVEYFEIVDGNTLETVHSWNDSPYIVGCITVYCGATPIRLIDHIKYK